MPRGQPDYGLTGSTPVASGISDPGEAAARLGSINVYDRRGWTVWIDDFEAPTLRWGTWSAGGGILPRLVTTEAWMGVQSVYLSVPGVDGDISRLYKFFPLVRLGRIGFEFFTYLGCVSPNYLRLLVNIYDGTNVATAELRLDNRARTATIVTPLGNIVVATDCFPLVAFNMFNPVKLVVDMDTDHYTRLLIGPEDIDISTHSLVNGGATTQKLLEVYIELRGQDGGPSACWIDNFILTQNEP